MSWNRTERPPFQSTLNHVAVQDPGGGFWMVGYQVWGTQVVTVLEDGHTEDSAKRQARQLNFPNSKPVRRGWVPDRAVYAPSGL